MGDAMTLRSNNTPRDPVTGGYLVCCADAFQFVYSDADVVGGKVRVFLGYEGGPSREFFNREDGAPLFDPFQNIPDTSVPINSSPFTEIYWYQSNDGTYNIFCNGGRGYGVNPGDRMILANHRSDVDCSIDVVAPSSGQAGLLLRASGFNGIYYDSAVLDMSVNRIVLRLLTNPSGDQGIVLTGTTPIAAGTQYTIRATVTGNVYDLYVNGNHEGSHTLTAGPQRENAANLAHGFIWDVGSSFANWVIAKSSNPRAGLIARVLNYDGDTVWTSLLSDLPDPSIVSIPDSVLTQRDGRGPYGWYRLKITGPDHGADSGGDPGGWGDAYGDTSFARISNSSLPARPPRRHYPGGSEVSNHPPLDGIMGYGAGRIVIDDASADPSIVLNDATFAVRLSRTQTTNLDGSNPTNPSRHYIAFTNGTYGLEANVTTIVAGFLARGYSCAWETRNEPNGYWGVTYQRGIDFFNGEWFPFYQAVVAGDPHAVVLGPAIVTYNHEAQSIFLDGFVAAWVAAGRPARTGWSFHPYNMYNGDLTMIRGNLARLLTTVTPAGEPADAAPAFTAASPPSAATVNVAYPGYQFETTGFPIVSFGVVGSLPPGMWLGANGLLFGTPTAGGVYTFTVVATNGVSPAATTSPLTLTVTGGSNAATVNGVALSSIATIEGIPRASVETVDGVIV